MTKTVLIVEDNELNMKLFRDLLEAHDIKTIEMREGSKILEVARENRPDLILMDIQLPEVSGLEITKWLKNDEELRSIPVIAVTAFAMKGDEQKIREGGCEDYISKPIAVTDFMNVIHKYIDRDAEAGIPEDGDDKPAEEGEDDDTKSSNDDDSAQEKSQ